jgi:hypothetical protein
MCSLTDPSHLQVRTCPREAKVAVIDDAMSPLTLEKTLVAILHELRCTDHRARLTVREQLAIINASLIVSSPRHSNEPGLNSHHITDNSGRERKRRKPNR